MPDRDPEKALYELMREIDNHESFDDHLIRQSKAYKYAIKVLGWDIDWEELFNQNGERVAAAFQHSWDAANPFNPVDDLEAAMEQIAKETSRPHQHGIMANQYTRMLAGETVHCIECGYPISIDNERKA